MVGMDRQPLSYFCTCASLACGFSKREQARASESKGLLVVSFARLRLFTQLAVEVLL